MPFLLPAVSAALCDIAIVYLSRSDGIYRETLEEESLTRLVYQSGYVLPTAAIRLFLLMIPLPYHSYNGTALKFSYLYQILYIGTLLTLLIHMLSLGMVDPSSLSSLVKTAPTMEELAVRHLWSILSLSLTSNLCHILLLLHVRSTAPADNAELGRAKVLLYYVKEREDTELDSLLGQQIERPNSDASNRMRHMVMEVHSRLQKAKKDWTKQLDDYLVRSGGNGSQDLLQRPLTPFRVLLQLFAYEDVLTNGKLDAVYDRDDGRALMFFVPQLLSFLLHGAYDSSPRLEEWILDTCRRNVYFAHRCYWFLRAWSLESNATGDGRPARLSKSSSLASFENLDDSSASLDASNKFLPEVRDETSDMDPYHFLII